MFSSIPSFLSSVFGTGVSRVSCSASLTVTGLLLVAAWPAGSGAQTIVGTVNVGSSTTATVTASIPAAVTPSSISVVTQGAEDLDFTDAGGGTCKVGVAYAAKATCTVMVTFKPKYAGTRYGAVVLAGESSVMATAYIQGTGVAPQVGFLPGKQSYLNIGSGYPFGVALDGSGNVYVADGFSFTSQPAAVYMATRSSNFTFQTKIGSGFVEPTGVAVDGSGNVYISDFGDKTVHSAVYKETLSNGTFTQAKVATGFHGATGVAVDGSGNVYVTDYGSGAAQSAVYKETLSNGIYTQTMIGSGWSVPTGIAVDESGNVYVSDYGRPAVYKETPLNGAYVQTTVGSGWKTPEAVTVDGSGNVYVADDGDIHGAHVGIYRGTLLNGIYTWTSITLHNEEYTTVPPCSPAGMALDGSGDVFAGSNCSVIEVDVLAPQAFNFLATAEGATSYDSPKTVAVFNSGNADLIFSEVSYPANFPEDTKAADNCTASTSLATGESCNLSIDFTPVAAMHGQKGLLPLSGDVTVTDNALYLPHSQQQAATVAGFEYPPAYQITLAASADPSVVGSPVTFTLTLTGSNGAPTGTATFYLETQALAAAVKLKGGVATYTTSALPVGSYTIKATYSGDSTYSGSSETIIANIIGPAPISPFGNLSMGTVKIGSASSAIPVTATFKTAETLGSVAVLTQGAAGLDFRNAGGGTCTAGRAYAAKATCTVNVTFTPLYAGTRYGAVVLRDTNGNVIGTGYLQGTGQGPQTTFLPGTHVSLDKGYVHVAGVAVDGSGNLYVIDSGDLLVEGGTIHGVVHKETLLPNGKYARATIGYGFLVPWSVAVDGSGNVYIADQFYSAVFKETLQSDGSYVQTMIGSGFRAPNGVAVDGSGNVYIADFGYFYEYGAVYKETLSNGNYIQSEIGSGWGSPAGVAVDGSGNVYVADWGTAGLNGNVRPSVRKETPSGDNYLQTEIGSGWLAPYAIAVDGSGNIFVLDYWQASVYRETPSEGTYTQTVVIAPVGTQVLFLEGVAVDFARNVYITDFFSNSVAREECGMPPQLAFAKTAHGVVSQDSPRTVTVSNLGNAPLQFSAVSYPADFPEGSGVATDCKSSTLLAEEEDCTLTIDFKPVAALGGSRSETLQEAVTVTTGTLNTKATAQKVAVAGSEIVATATPVFSVPGGTYTSPIKLIITDSTPRSTIYYSTGGPPPTTDYPKYTGPITISGNLTIKAMAVAPGYAQSAVATAVYTIK